MTEESPEVERNSFNGLNEDVGNSSEALDLRSRLTSFKKLKIL